jgi:hypothetical protein
MYNSTNTALNFSSFTLKHALVTSNLHAQFEGHTTTGRLFFDPQATFAYMVSAGVT